MSAKWTQDVDTSRSMSLSIIVLEVEYIPLILYEAGHSCVPRGGSLRGLIAS